ncbi:terminase [Endozoicomonas montiporae]|uniref:Terminase n=2 Tax=Endozoicomonas montiporae TaxID=1027273 RepID=A0A081N313_9GAMM|nr:terminase TerL endonuclease subunit [Endozoicomonas montiporae]AMO58122.1 phage terminase-like protein, large subunit [Endozoicomonas montiporae CL-33]KEQ12836.1 terminase [Endozoicomonas montiporae]
MPNPNVNKANKYARDIVAGNISACRFVRQSCQRHLNDLAKEKERGFKYKFNRAAAERACKFIQQMPHTKGEWAFKKMLIKLEPWQLFIVASVFGWQHKKGGLRRFREVYTEIPRKNGKSAISAGVGVYMLAADNEFGAEVYSGATSEKQAWEVFRPARLMCKKSPDLLTHFGIEVNAKNLNRPADDARFEPVIGNPGDGASPSCAIVDEYHEHDSDSLFTTMLTGMGARKQPLMWVITTAGFNVDGPCYDKRREVVETLENYSQLKSKSKNDELFGIIYTIDEGDDWSKVEALEKANPNMGVSVYRDYLISQQQRAIANARFTNRFKTKHLNVWVSAKTAFFNLQQWKACEDKELSLEQFEGHDRLLSFDMAARLDLTAMVSLFTRDIEGQRHYYCIAPKFFVPEATVFDNDNRSLAERYQTFVNDGCLIATEGAEIDYRDVLAEAMQMNQCGSVIECPIDPHGATALAHQLADENMNPVIIKQNFTGMSDGMKELEAAVASNRFHHDGNPVMTWCIGNVVGKYLAGSDDIVRPIKEAPDSKIDGAVALIQAMGRAMLNDHEDTLSDHIESVGIRSL